MHHCFNVPFQRIRREALQVWARGLEVCENHVVVAACIPEGAKCRHSPSGRVYKMQLHRKGGGDAIRLSDLRRIISQPICQ